MVFFFTFCLLLSRFFPLLVLCFLLQFSFIFILSFLYLVSFFSFSLFVIASFEKVRDVHGWLVDREAFEPKATRSKVDLSRWLFGLKYEVLEKGFLVNKKRIVDGVEKGYFYPTVFACGLRFSFSNFMVKVLKAYDVMSSQLHPNCWEIMGTFFLDCWENDIMSTFRMFKRFYSLKQKK